MIWRLVVACVIVCCLQSGLLADLVVFNVTGIITSVNQNGQNGSSIGSAGQVNLGDAFSASLSYDTSTSGGDLNGSGTQGLYFMSANPNNQVSFTIDGLTFQTVNGTGLVAQTFDDTVSTLSNNTDLLAVQSSSITLPNLWSATQATATIGLADPNGLAMPNDTLPTSISPLFSQGLIQLSFNQGATINGSSIPGLFIEGAFTVSAVPEPTSIFLLAVAVPIAGALGKRKHKRKRLARAASEN